MGALLLFGIPALFIFYRLVVHGEPGKPSLMDLHQERFEREEKAVRAAAELRAWESFKNLSRRYEAGEIEWRVVWETMWLAHPVEMEKWTGEWERGQTRH